MPGYMVSITLPDGALQWWGAVAKDETSARGHVLKSASPPNGADVVVRAQLLREGMMLFQFDGKPDGTCKQWEVGTPIHSSAA